MGEGPAQRRGRLAGDVRMVVRRRTKLPRTLGTGALFSACYGNVGSSIYYGLGVTAAFALGLTPVALVLAGCIFITTALCYAEGTAAMPQAGGSSSFARRAFNLPLGFFIGWVQLLNYTATVAISSYTAVAYLAALGRYLPFLTAVQQPVVHVVVTVILVGLLIVINVIGIQESSLMNLVLSLLDLGTQLLLVLLGALLLINIGTLIHNVHLGVAPTWGNFLVAISLGMVTYTGIETISNMSEEARNPGRTVPRATFMVIAAVMVVSAALPTIGVSVFPVHYDPATHQFLTDLGSPRYRNDPVSGIVGQFHPAWLAQAAQAWVSILAFTILVIGSNAGLIGISRLSYSLASRDLFPKAFARLHPRFQTPYVAIVVFGIASCVLVLSGEITLMAAVYSLAATFAFSSAHLSVIRLRYVEPDMRRPFRIPLNIPFGRSSIPLLSALGFFAIATVFLQLMLENVNSSSLILLGWFAAGVLAWIAYRRYRRAPLWEPMARAPEPPRAGAPSPEVESQPREQRVRVKRRPSSGDESAHRRTSPDARDRPVPSTSPSGRGGPAGERFRLPRRRRGPS
ncbi:MAG: APC family permease [Candidatus Dormibacteraeota bacterium]|nr:APC family permease [Candidatus Dormibacteraeota bacterium]